MIDLQEVVGPVLSIGTKSSSLDDLETHSAAEKMHLLERNAQI